MTAHLSEVYKIIKLIEIENRMLVARGWVEVEIGSYSGGMKLQLYKRKKF